MPDELLTFQHFFRDENLYCQAFVNLSQEMPWSQKMVFKLRNMDIIGFKNQRKPISLKIKPLSSNILIIQQVGGGPFILEGGEGATFLPGDDKRMKIKRRKKRGKSKYMSVEESMLHT